MYRKICVTNRHLAERPFLEQLERVLATKPYAMILREKDLTEEAYEELAGKVKKYRTFAIANPRYVCYSVCKRRIQPRVKYQRQQKTQAERIELYVS